MTDKPGDGVSLTSIAHPDPLKEAILKEFASEIRAAMNPAQGRDIELYGPPKVVGEHMAKVIMRMIEWHWDRMNEEHDLDPDSTEEAEYDFSKLLGKKHDE